MSTSDGDVRPGSNHRGEPTTSTAATPAASGGAAPGSVADAVARAVHAA